MDSEGFGGIIISGRDGGLGVGVGRGGGGGM